ncbi:hypothetical protein Pmar_PMAR003549 [Perkinsus marinus ATCC 50983]|uniref:Uncharacterized protein n=1 Tax=Perkinsus marinus (strain ATCC 50983 / TXsc) TaxID=423536 RepID=C5KHM4_PERM5|nr:hypothetical protein Pmar_PMAR003549 [Perkinsus marinus ATCC 50983]EER16086.1 hypothetical protein Pmar_PMAR003549 [Perkinsus marinus ATCC 50983]|eukprot:XP_002784290.1 hypothetical protein Pmar_PMAR003549 [Perkinsus marinus ATCC 50983]
MSSPASRVEARLIFDESNSVEPGGGEMSSRVEPCSSTRPTLSHGVDREQVPKKVWTDKLKEVIQQQFDVKDESYKNVCVVQVKAVFINEVDVDIFVANHPHSGEPAGIAGNTKNRVRNAYRLVGSIRQEENKLTSRFIR